MPRLKKSNLYSKENMECFAKEYDEVRSFVKEYKAKQDNLSSKLKEGLDKLGVKDDKGSYYYETPTYIVGKVAKNKVSIDTDKAVEILKKKGLTNCYSQKVVNTVNEEEIEKAVSAGLLSLEEVNVFSKNTVTYSVSVKKKEVAPEVTLSSVAKRK